MFSFGEPAQESNETFQAITAAQRGREAADPLAKFLSDPQQMCLGMAVVVRSWGRWMLFFWRSPRNISIHFLIF